MIERTKIAKYIEELSGSCSGQHEAGFSLAETLVALLVMSLAMTALAGFVSHSIKVQSHIQKNMSDVREMALAYMDETSVTLKDGSVLSFRRIQRDTPASCLYDVLQGRCR